MKTINEIKTDLFNKEYQKIRGKIVSEIYKAIRDNKDEVIIDDFYKNDIKVIKLFTAELKSSGYTIGESNFVNYGLFISLID